MNTHQDKDVRYLQTVSILERQPRNSLIKLTDLNYLAGKKLCIQNQKFSRNPCTVTKLFSETQTEIPMYKDKSSWEGKEVAEVWFSNPDNLEM